MSAPHHETGVRASIEAAWQRCRAWIGGGTSSEFKYLDDQEVARMAHDAGVTMGEFRQLVRRSPGSADLLLKRMAALDLDKNEVRKLEPEVFRDLQRVCSICQRHGRCKHDLMRDPSDPAWKSYCPNVETLMGLDALPWSSRAEA
jgi:hypothetical protein